MAPKCLVGWRLAAAAVFVVASADLASGESQPSSPQQLTDEALNQSLNDSAWTIQQLQDLLSAEQARSRQLEQDLARIRSHVDELETAVDTSTKSVEGQLAQTERHLATLRSDLDAQRAASAAAQREREKLLKEVGSVRTQLAERDAALMTSASEGAQLAEKYAQAERAFTEAAKERDEALEGRRHLQASYDQGDAQRVEIQRQLSELREQFRAAESGRQDQDKLRKTLEERERALKESKAQVAKLEEQSRRAAEDIEQQRKQQDAKLEEAQQSWNKLKQELERVVAERDRADNGVRDELAKLQETLVRERAAREELVQANKTLAQRGQSQVRAAEPEPTLRPTVDTAHLERQVAKLTKERDAAVAAQERTHVSMDRAQGAWEEERLSLNTRLNEMARAAQEGASTSRRQQSQVGQGSDQLQAQIVKLQAQVNALAQEREQLRAERTRDRAKGAEELEALRAKLTSAHAVAPAEPVAAPARSERADAGQAKLRKQLEKTAEERDAAVAARRVAKWQLAELKRDIASLTKDQGKIQTVRTQHAREQSKLEDQLASAQAAVNTLKTELVDAKDQLQEHEAALQAHATMAKELASLRDTHELEREAREQAETALAALKTERQAAVEVAEEQVEYVEQQLVNVRNDLIESQEQLAQRDIAIEKVQASWNRLKQELDYAVAERDRADAAYAALKQESEAARQVEAWQVDDSIAALQQEVAALTEERATLRNEQARAQQLGEQEFGQPNAQLEEDQRAKVAYLEQELVRLTEERDAASAAQQRAQASLASSQALWEAKREADQERLLMQIAELQQQVAALKQEQETTGDAEQVRELQTALADSQQQLETNVGALKAALEHKDQELADYREALAGLADRRVAETGRRGQERQQPPERPAVIEAQPAPRLPAPSRPFSLLERAQETPRALRPDGPQVIEAPPVQVSATAERDRAIAMEIALRQLEQQRIRAKPVSAGTEWSW